MPQALRPFTLGLLLAATCVTVPDTALAAKKKVPELADLSATAPGEVMDKGLAALRAGDSKLAIHAFAELAAREPRNGTAQALLGLSYQLSADRNPQALDLAILLGAFHHFAVVHDPRRRASSSVRSSSAVRLSIPCAEIFSRMRSTSLSRSRSTPVRGCSFGGCRRWLKRAS